MAVHDVTKVSARSTGRGSVEGREAVDVYQIVTDLADSQDVARTAAGVPQIGDAFPTDAQKVVTNNEVAAVSVVDGANYGVSGEVRLWEATVRYATVAVSGPSGFPDDPEGGGDPLARPDDIRYGGQTRQEPIRQAFKLPGTTLEPVVNSAGIPYDPPPVDDFTDDVIEITRNVSVINLAIVNTYQGALNGPGSDAFNGAYQCVNGQARMEITAERLYEGIFYWRVTYRIAFRRTDSGWYQEAEERGTMARPAAGQPPEVITDDNGLPVDEPQPLKADGTFAEDGIPATTLWRTAPEAGYDALQLPVP